MHSVAEIAKRWETTPDRIKDLKDGTYVMAHRLMFHWMIRGFFDTPFEYFDRWRYETEELVMKAVTDFVEEPPAGYEPSGWHRHPPTRRRRPAGDPTREYIDP